MYSNIQQVLNLYFKRISGPLRTTAKPGRTKTAKPKQVNASILKHRSFKTLFDTNDCFLQVHDVDLKQTNFTRCVNVATHLGLFF